MKKTFNFSTFVEKAFTYCSVPVFLLLLKYWVAVFSPNRWCLHYEDVFPQ